MGNFRLFISKPFNRGLVFLVVVFIILFTGIYYLLDFKAQKSLVEQTLHREQVIARAGASSIESFLKLLGNSVSSLATRSSVVDTGETTVDTLQIFADRWQGTPVAGVILTDKQGTIVASANNRGVAVQPGTSVADRDYFAWAKKALSGEVFISNPMISKYGSSYGKYIVVLATPVGDQGFNGVLAASVIISDLVDAYLDPLKISPDTEVYVVNSKGDFVSSPYTELLGKSILDFIDETKIPGKDYIKDKVKIALEKGGEGKLDILHPNLFNSDSKSKVLTRKLIAYSSLTNEKERWLLVIAEPYEEVMLFFHQFSLINISVLVLAVITVIVFAFFTVKHKHGN